MRGRCIAFDGIDGCGKDLQRSLLGQYLTDYHGITVSYLEEPWRSPKSPCDMMIDRVLSGKQTEIDDGDTVIDHVKLQKLYLCDRLLLWTLEIEPRLESGEIILLSRDRMSTLAYGHAYGISMDEIDSWHRFIPSPDLYLYLYVSAGVALRRILARCEKTGQRVEYFEKLNSLMKITSSYEDVYRSGLIKNANRVNGNNKPDKVAKHVQEHVTTMLGLDK